MLGQRLRGEGKTYHVIFLGGKTYCRTCSPKPHFWRPQKLGLVWSVPLSTFKGNDRESPKRGGGTYRRWGALRLFWGGLLRVCSPPPPRVFDPPWPGSLTCGLMRVLQPDSAQFRLISPDSGTHTLRNTVWTGVLANEGCGPIPPGSAPPGAVISVTLCAFGSFPVLEMTCLEL